MSGFAQNRSFCGVDLHHLLHTDKSLMRRLVENVVDLAERGEIRRPTPVHLYPVSQVEQAFRYIQSGKNTGRAVLTASRQDIVTVSPSGGTHFLRIILC